MVKAKRSRDAYRPVFVKERTESKEIYNVEGQSKDRSKYRIYLVALISIVFLLFALSFLFSGAKIILVPKVRDIPVKENLSATKDGNLPGLSFDLVVISGEESKTIEGGEMKEVSIVASGSVVIYNSYSSSSQNLDVDTRLEGSNGKIYKTNKKITIPGMTKDGKPGSAEVGIYGGVAGPEYNSTPLDFKIIGFKGTPKYAKFYARSKGEIVGGFKGMSPSVSSLDKASATSELGVILRAKLQKKVADQIPGGFVLFKDAIFLDIKDEDVSFTLNKDDTMLVSIKGSVYGFLFDEEKLTKKIAEDIIDQYDGSEVYMPNIRDLVFSLSDRGSPSFADVRSISFTLSGTPKIIWKVDEGKFVADILGKKKKDFNEILSKHPNIDSAELVLRPFWKTYFPEEGESIEVIVNYPE